LAICCSESRCTHCTSRNFSSPDEWSWGMDDFSTSMRRQPMRTPENKQKRYGSASS